MYSQAFGMNSSELKLKIVLKLAILIYANSNCIRDSLSKQNLVLIERVVDV